MSLPLSDTDRGDDPEADAPPEGDAPPPLAAAAEAPVADGPPTDAAAIEIDGRPASEEDDDEDTGAGSQWGTVAAVAAVSGGVAVAAVARPGLGPELLGLVGAAIVVVGAAVGVVTLRRR